jgi:PPOX class probable F420-dependent enzyme
VTHILLTHHASRITHPPTPTRRRAIAGTLPDHVRTLLAEPNIVFIATLMKDGAPRVTPVWVDLDGDVILVNTVQGRATTRNLERDQRVALSVTDRNDPYNWASIRGRVVAITEEGADAHIDTMARKYLGQDRYPYRRDGEVRVILRIEPETISVASR